MPVLAALDATLASRPPAQIVALAVAGVGIVGYADFVTGHEVSMGPFYVGPVALAAWYVGRGSGVALAVLCSVVWYLASIDNPFTHQAIPVWNAVARLGFFLISGLLLSALRASLAQAQHLAQTDSLTGLYSRRAFLERLEHDLASARRRRRPIALAYVDLDDFKGVNDTYGHAEGDRVLQIAARALRRKVRRVDTVARLGGDEFALALPDTDETGARQLIAGLGEELRAAFREVGRELTCSIGVVAFAEPAVSTQEAVAAADALMYEAKRQGKGRVAFAAR